MRRPVAKRKVRLACRKEGKSTWSDPKRGFLCNWEGGDQTELKQGQNVFTVETGNTDLVFVVTARFRANCPDCLNEL